MTKVLCPSLLFISNGHGEDMIAQAIIDQIKDKTLRFKALPLVGMGRDYDTSRVELLDPRMELPSGGFACQGIGYLLKDVFAGLLWLVLSQIKTLLAVRDSIYLTVAVGDVYSLILACLFIRRPIVFVATYKSEYTGGYLAIERWIMRHCAKVVFPRDEPTCFTLSHSGLKAIFVGNVMMDCVRGDGDLGLNLTKDTKVIGLLPGSRKEAYRNLREILIKLKAIIRLSKEEKVIFLLALAPTLTVEPITRYLPGGWSLVPASGSELDKGIVANIYGGPEIEVKVVQKRFGEVIRSSHLILGLAGTANEQAAGMCKPVVSFIGHGPQTTKKRMLEQKRLLGDAISFVDGTDEAVAREVWRILRDPDLALQMAAAGRERMGPPGAARRIASFIIDCIEQGE